MEPFCARVCAQQWLVRAGVNRDVAAATKLKRGEGIAHALLNIHIAGDDGQRAHIHVRRAQRHYERNGVVRGGVGVNDESAGHVCS